MSWNKLLKLISNNRFFNPRINKRMTFANCKVINHNKWLRLNHPKFYKHDAVSYAVAISILSWLGFTDDDEKKESELIMTLKRAVLCIQREQYEKAEQMLHLALRLAQQRQNQQGILYCYDLMANLAFDTFKLEKAEKLFVSVLQILLGSGIEQDDIKVIHISLKMARIAQLQADLPKAELGYKWCLEHIKNLTEKDNKDAKNLEGIIHDWYAQFLMDKGDLKEATIHLKEAYNICREIEDENVEQSMLLLNDLAIANFRAGDINKAQDLLNEAIEVGKDESSGHIGVVKANLGLILLEKGIKTEAKKSCLEAYKLGKKHENNEAIEQANYCLDQIKLNIQK